MLKLVIEGKETFNQKTQQFGKTPSVTLELEHSLVSLAKWESKHQKPFLKDDDKTKEEMIDYIRFMTITQNVNPEVYNQLSKDEMKKINDYIQSPQTATKFYQNVKGEGVKESTSSKKDNKVMTSEEIYYLMISFQIPFECQRWHLNRLLTLIKVCSIKERQQNGKGGRMSKRDILAQNNALNAARRQRMKTRG